MCFLCVLIVLPAELIQGGEKLLVGQLLRFLAFTVKGGFPEMGGTFISSIAIIHYSHP